MGGRGGVARKTNGSVIDQWVKDGAAATGSSVGHGAPYMLVVKEAVNTAGKCSIAC